MIKLYRLYQNILSLLQATVILWIGGLLFAGMFVGQPLSFGDFFPIAVYSGIVLSALVTISVLMDHVEADYLRNYDETLQSEISEKERELAALQAQVQAKLEARNAINLSNNQN